jgi:hypothetical protein
VQNTESCRRQLRHPKRLRNVVGDERAALARSGEAAEARELLAPVNDWFTEGFETRDLRRRSEVRMSCHFRARHDALNCWKANISGTFGKERRCQYANRCSEHHVI